MRHQRMQTLADIWGKVYLFHPAIVTQDIDWNQALIQTIPEIEEARDAHQLVNVINERLLGPLNDRMTFAMRSDETGPAETGTLGAERLTDSLGYVRVPVDQGRSPALPEDFWQACNSLQAAKALVVDLRWDAAPDPANGIMVLFQFFARTRLRTGPVMRRVHLGWTEDNRLRSAYQQKWEVLAGTELGPIRTPSGFAQRLYRNIDFAALKPIDLPTVFLVNRASLPYTYRTLDALQSQSGIAVAYEPTGPSGMYEEDLLNYPEGITVQLNTERLVGRNGQAGFQPSVVASGPIPRQELSEVAERALAARTDAHGEVEAQAVLAMNLPPPLTETKENLTREERLLGLFKIWTVVRFFDPHLENADIDWDTCLADWIPRVEAAGSLVEYRRTLLTLAAHLHDSHVYVRFAPRSQPIRSLPVKLGCIEDRIVITGTMSGSTGLNPPLEIGDEVVEFDGKTVPDLIADYRTRISASTEGAFYRAACNAMYFGDPDSEVEIAVMRGGMTVSAKLKRTVLVPAPEEAEPNTRLLPCNLGYIDLGRVPSFPDLDSTLQSLAATDGLILDLRGYPKFLHDDLVSRLCDRPVRSGTFEIPIVSDFDRLTARWSLSQRLVQPHPKTHYDRPVVVLINERAISASENLCTFLKNARRVTFVGSPTTGANGNVAYISLPGGGRMSFTGMRVRFADGSRFQNIGILPDVPVRPTIAGIKAGRDEVLEKGIETLKELIRTQKK